MDVHPFRGLHVFLVMCCASSDEDMKIAVRYEGWVTKP